MKELLIEEEGLNLQGRSVCTGKCGGSIAVAIPLGDVSGGTRHQKL